MIEDFPDSGIGLACFDLVGVVGHNNLLKSWQILLHGGD